MSVSAVLTYALAMIAAPSDGLRVHSLVDMQAYAVNHRHEERLSAAPAPASLDAGPPREASTYAPPDWAGPSPG